MEVRMINDKKCFVHSHEIGAHPDNIAISMMEQNDIDGLIPFRYVHMGDEKYFRYEAGMNETLTEWLERSHYKTDVMQLIESLIFTGEEIEAYLLAQNHICIDHSFIIVKDNKCKTAYIPLEEEIQGSIFQLVQNIIFSVKYAVDENFGYLFDLQNAFGRKDIQNMNDLKRWLRIVNGEIETSNTSENARIDKEDDMASHSDAPVASSLSQEIGMNKPVPEIESVMNIKDSKKSSDPFDGIFGDIGLSSKSKKNKKDKIDKKDKSNKKDNNIGVGKQVEKHGLFSKNKSKNDNNIVVDNRPDQSVDAQKIVPKREIINDLDRGDMTEMADTGSSLSPKLIRAAGGMEYNLTQYNYVIGSGAQTDITLSNNRTVSRRHAQIFMSNEDWYIEDLGSTNGTCVNGERLRKMEPYKLDDGAKIQISNETYIFENKG